MELYLALHFDPVSSDNKVDVRSTFCLPGTSRVEQEKIICGAWRLTIGRQKISDLGDGASIVPLSPKVVGREFLRGMDFHVLCGV